MQTGPSGGARIEPVTGTNRLRLSWGTFMGLAVSAAVMALTVGGSAAPAGTGGAGSLREAARGCFPIGVGVSDRIPERAEDWSLLETQFSIITPENCLKPDPVQVAEGRLDRKSVV